MELNIQSTEILRAVLNGKQREKNKMLTSDGRFVLGIGSNVIIVGIVIGWSQWDFFMSRH